MDVKLFSLNSNAYSQHNGLRAHLYELTLSNLEAICFEEMCLMELDELMNFVKTVNIFEYGDRSILGLVEDGDVIVDNTETATRIFNEAFYDALETMFISNFDYEIPNDFTVPIFKEPSRYMEVVLLDGPDGVVAMRIVNGSGDWEIAKIPDLYKIWKQAKDESRLLKKVFG